LVWRPATLSESRLPKSGTNLQRRPPLLFEEARVQFKNPRNPNAGNP
jgi:hypothetical protein